MLFQLVQKVSAGFQGFWVRWPRKVARRDAELTWNKVVISDSVEDAIHKALDWQVPLFLEREEQYRPHAKTWLNGRRWEDEPPTTTPSRVIAKAPVVTIRPQTTMAEQQMDARNRINSLVATGMDREEAKRQVYLELGWITEGQR